MANIRDRQTNKDVENILQINQKNFKENDIVVVDYGKYGGGRWWGGIITKKIQPKHTTAVPSEFKFGYEIWFPWRAGPWNNDGSFRNKKDGGELSTYIPEDIISYASENNDDDKPTIYEILQLIIEEYGENFRRNSIQHQILSRVLIHIEKYNDLQTRLATLRMRNAVYLPNNNEDQNRSNRYNNTLQITRALEFSPLETLLGYGVMSNMEGSKPKRITGSELRDKMQDSIPRQQNCVTRNIEKIITDHYLSNKLNALFKNEFKRNDVTYIPISDILTQRSNIFKDSLCYLCGKKIQEGADGDYQYEHIIPAIHASMLQLVPRKNDEEQN